MDTELVIGIAQILTAIATLIVAVFLAGQLIIQKGALNRAHRDAESELAFSSRNTISSLLLARLTSDGRASVTAKGFESIDNLSESQDLLRFTGYLRQVYHAFLMEWSLSRDSLDIGDFKERMSRLFVPTGGRQFYSQTGREIIKIRSEELREICDELYELYEGNPGAA